MNKISYGRQDITSDDIAAVVSALKSDFLTQGPLVEQFETDFAKFVGSDYAVAVTNATAALHISALALGTKKGTRVLTSPNTFVASANCVRFCEGDVEFVDIDPATLCMDLNKLEETLKAAPKNTYQGVIPVSFAGYPVDTERIRKLADQYGLWIIEDACHAPGAEFKNSKGTWVKSGSGEYADLSIFSFHPVKHIATGEGGMITTRNKELYEKLKLLRSHGITRDSSKFTRQEGGWYHEMQSLGFNYRMPDLNCALGISQLKRIDSNLEARRKIARRYSEELSGLPLKTPLYPENIKHAFHLYVIQIEQRKNLYEFLKTKDIYCQVHYIPVHQQPYYAELYGKKTFAEAEKYYSQCLSLPMYHSLSAEEQTYVINQIKAFYV